MKDLITPGIIQSINKEKKKKTSNIVIKKRNVRKKRKNWKKERKDTANLVILPIEAN